MFSRFAKCKAAYFYARNNTEEGEKCISKKQNQIDDDSEHSSANTCNFIFDLHILWCIYFKFIHIFETILDA